MIFAFLQNVAWLFALQKIFGIQRLDAKYLFSSSVCFLAYVASFRLEPLAESIYIIILWV